MKIKYIGFDKDGTLIDSPRLYTQKWGEIINLEFGINEEEAKRVFDTEAAGKPTTFQLELVLQEHNIFLPQKELFEKANEIALIIGQTVKASLFPDVEKTLQKLKRKGYFIFLSTGQQEIIAKLDLERLNITKYFDLIEGIRPDDPSFKKEEQHFYFAAEYFHIPFEEFTKQAVFIGDTQADISIANKFNIISIGRIGTLPEDNLKKAGAKITVKDFTNLIEIIEAL